MKVGGQTTTLPSVLPQFNAGSNAPTLPSPFVKPASAAAGISNAGAFTPDWAALIQGDPGLQATEANLAAANVSDLASRNAAIANALESFGGPIGFSSLAQKLGLTSADLQDLGPEVEQIAKENDQAGTSTSARLNQANTDAINQIKANLNKRGLLNSGELPFELDRQNLSYRQAQSDATDKLLSALQQYQQGYLTAQNQRNATLAQAYGTAEANQLANPANQSSPGTSATFAFVDANGNAVYRDAGGNYYNSDGSRWAGVVSSQAPPAPAPTPATVPPSLYTPGQVVRPGQALAY